MPRAKFDPAACDSLTSCVSEIEKTTEAEVVIVVRARSGHYRHADYLAGAILARPVYSFSSSPLRLSQYWFVADVIILFGLGPMFPHAATRSGVFLRAKSFAPKRPARRRGNVL